MAKENIPPILSVQEFDRSIKKDPNLENQIAGFSSVSVSHIQKGILQNNFEIQPWGIEQRYVRVSLNSHTTRALGVETNPNSFLEKLTANREHGLYWAGAEAYQTISPQATEEDLMELTGYIPFAELVNNFTKKFRSYSNFIKEFQNYSGDPFALSHLTESIDRFFYKFSDFDNLLSDVRRNRRGVQVIYGPTDQFLEFINEKGYTLDYEDGAIDIPSAIPADLVQVLIPLGRHEENILRPFKLA